MKYIRKFEYSRDYYGYHKGIHVVTLVYYHHHYYNKWVIETPCGITYVSKSGYNCFTLAVAKQIVKEELQEILSIDQKARKERDYVNMETCNIQKM